MNFSFSTIINRFKGLLGKEDQIRVTGKKKSPATRTAGNTHAEAGGEQPVRPKAATSAGKKRAKVRAKKKTARGKKSK